MRRRRPLCSMPSAECDEGRTPNNLGGLTQEASPRRRLRAMNVSMASQEPALLRRLLRAKDLMDAASEEYWPVERLANISGVSAAHFARSFKEAFGVPPHRYLLTRRIERAKALLRDTDAPIIDVAFQTGW